MKTKNTLIIIVMAAFFSFGSAQVRGQEFRVNAYSGYSFDDRVNTYFSTSDYYEGTIEGSYRWGVGAEYLLQQRYGLELNYTRQDTKAPIRYYQIKDRQTTLILEWIGLH